MEDNIPATGGLAEVVDDTTPQLGGALDSNAHQINWSKGADVASANALTLGTDGNLFDITGTTAITSIGTLGIGTVVMLHFDGILTLTHNATDLILPGAANITTAAGDMAMFVEYATGDWRCVSYAKADGTPIACAPGGADTQVQFNDGGSFGGDASFQWDKSTKILSLPEIRALDAGGLKLYDDGGNGLFIEDGGNVGIGTASPDTALHVLGALTLEDAYGKTGKIEYASYNVGSGWFSVTAGGTNDVIFRVADLGNTIFMVGTSNHASSFRDDLNVGGDLSITGTVKGKIDELIQASTDTLIAAEIAGTIINNYGQGAANTQTLPAAAEGLNALFVIATIGNAFHIDVQATDKIYLDGAALDDGDKISNATPAIGDNISIVAFQTGVGAYDWRAQTIQGTWVDGGA